MSTLLHLDSQQQVAVHPADLDAEFPSFDLPGEAGDSSAVAKGRNESATAENATSELATLPPVRRPGFAFGERNTAPNHSLQRRRVEDLNIDAVD